jgi:hypothetical protein
LVNDREAKTEPDGILHLVFWGTFLIFVLVFAGLLWTLMNVILPPSISLSKQPAWFSPIIIGGTRIHYVGFGVPFVLSIAMIVLLYRRKVGGRRVSRWIAALLIVTPVSFLLSQLTPLGLLVALGKTDVILLVALSVLLYYDILRLSAVDSVLLSYPVGFLLGLMSDIESAGYFNGVFGGYGMGDGDFLYPLSFAIGAFLFAVTWRPALDWIHRQQVKADAWMGKRARVCERCRAVLMLDK